MSGFRTLSARGRTLNYFGAGKQHHFELFTKTHRPQQATLGLHRQRGPGVSLHPGYKSNTVPGKAPRFHETQINANLPFDRRGSKVAGGVVAAGVVGYGAHKVWQHHQQHAAMMHKSIGQHRM